MFSSKEEILDIVKKKEELDTKIIEIGKFLGYIDKTWRYETSDIDTDKVYLTVYDYYYDLHDTREYNFPIECLYEEGYTERYKQEIEEKERLETELKRKQEEEKKEKQEREEYERLKKKYGD